MGDHSLVAEGAELDVVALGHQSPIIQRQHGEDPRAAAQTVDADVFTLQVRRSLDFGIDDEGAGQLVDKAGEKNQVGSLGDGADVGGRHRAPVDLGFTGAHRGDADRAVAHLHEGKIQPMFAEKSLILGDINHALPFADRADGHHHLGQRRRDLRCWIVGNR